MGGLIAASDLVTSLVFSSVVSSDAYTRRNYMKLWQNIIRFV